MGALSGAVQGAGTGAAVAGPYGALAGGLIGGIGGWLSSNEQEDAANRAAAQQMAMFQAGLADLQQTREQARTDLSPYMQTSQDANQRLGGLVAGMKQSPFDYQQQDFNFDTNSDPGAQYLMQQATQAINASSIGRGASGGGAIKAMQAQSQDMAGQAYSGAFDRYLKNSQMRQGQATDKYNRDMGFQSQQIGANADMANRGQQAALGIGNIGSQMSQAIGGMYGNIGDAQATGTMSAGNARAQGISSLATGLSRGLGGFTGMSGGGQGQGQFAGQNVANAYNSAPVYNFD